MVRQGHSKESTFTCHSLLEAVSLLSCFMSWYTNAFPRQLKNLKIQTLSLIRQKMMMEKRVFNTIEEVLKYLNFCLYDRITHFFSCVFEILKIFKTIFQYGRW